MFTKSRRQRHFKKKILTYIFLLGILSILVFFLNIFINSQKPLFISPLGKVGADVNHVQKILKDNKIPFSEVVLSGSTCEIGIQNNGKVRLSLDKNIDKQAASLQRILRELTIEGKSFKMIDFRFAEPVMSF